MGLLQLVVPLLVVCYTVTSRTPMNDPLTFLTEPWPYRLKFMTQHDTTVISCQTNHMFAKLYLYKRYNLRDSWRNALAMDRGPYITIVGQAFYIKDLAVKDSGYYKCVAAKYWSGEQTSLELGQLIVTPVKKTNVRLPEIFPNDAIIKVDQNSNQNISCKTIGAVGPRSYITWYKRNENGDLTQVPKSKVKSFSMLSGGNYVDLEKLMFKPFVESDAGIYVCERKEPFQRPTRQQIKIETNVDFVFKAPQWRIGDEVPLKIALINDFVFISCQTNSLKAQVLLMRKRAQTSPWHVVKTSYNGRVRQVGQTFLIKRLSYTDSAYYKCRATYKGSTIEMNKGMLIASIVDSKETPTITPWKPLLKIPKQANQDIVCKAPSVAGKENSYIRWYRKVRDDIFIYVQDELVEKGKMYSKGEHWDVHTLRFRQFNQQDAGQYACVRKIMKEPATVSYINVEMKGSKLWRYIWDKIQRWQTLI